ncbi:hypothetical protein BASA62_002738 [Batrachochytrium salamandrivorans]|nr:hypothetical protein BASA62_002738 [Batrachochytrium salamandrivorans]
MHLLAAINCDNLRPVLPPTSDMPYPSPTQSPYSASNPSLPGQSFTNAPLMLHEAPLEPMETMLLAKQPEYQVKLPHELAADSMHSTSDIIDGSVPKYATTRTHTIVSSIADNDTGSVLSHEQSQPIAMSTGSTWIPLVASNCHLALTPPTELAVADATTATAGRTTLLSKATTKRKQHMPVRAIARSMDMADRSGRRIVRLDVYDAFMVNPKQLLVTSLSTGSLQTEEYPGSGSSSNSHHGLSASSMPASTHSKSFTVSGSSMISAMDHVRKQRRFRRLGFNFASISTTSSSSGVAAATIVEHHQSRSATAISPLLVNTASYLPTCTPRQLALPITTNTSPSATTSLLVHSISSSAPLPSPPSSGCSVLLSHPTATLPPVSIATHLGLGYDHVDAYASSNVLTEIEVGNAAAAPSEKSRKDNSRVVKRRSSVTPRQPKSIPNFLTDIGVDTNVFDNSKFRNTKGASVVFWKAGSQPLKILPDAPSSAQLTKEELQTCATLRIYPDVYYNIKKTMLQAVTYYGPFKKREAQTWFRIDVNKICVIYDWFKTLGWIPNHGLWTTTSNTNLNQSPTHPHAGVNSVGLSTTENLHPKKKGAMKRKHLRISTFSTCKYATSLKSDSRNNVVLSLRTSVLPN